MLVDALGWLGVVLILGAYLAVSFWGLKATSAWYQTANFIGAASIGINTYVHEAYPSTIVNGIWTLIAGYAVLQIWWQIQKKQKAKL